MKNKLFSNPNTNNRHDYVSIKTMRMKKAEELIYSCSPFVLALIVQLITSVVGIFIYGIYMAIQLEPGNKISQIDIGKVINTQLTMDASLAISSFSAIVCIVVFYLWYANQLKNESSKIVKEKMRLKHIILVIILGFSLQVGFSFILNLIAMVKPSLFYKYGLMVEQLGGGTSIVSLIYIVVIAPISEELIFRGVLLNKAKKILPLLWANILQAFLFGVYHMNMIQGIYAFLIGMILGIICNGFKSIYAAIVLHVIINLCGLLLGEITMNEQYQTPIIFVGIIIIAMVCIIFSMIKLQKDFNQKEEVKVSD